MTVMAGELGGLPARTLEEIASVMGRFRDIRWVKLYGSRALGRQRPGSDIDLAFSAPIDHTAALAGALERACGSTSPAGECRCTAAVRHGRETSL